METSESKYEDQPYEESIVKYHLRDFKDPIVGLSYIHELRSRENGVRPIYNCVLCHTSSIATVQLVIEHVISLKHRLNYIKEKDNENYVLIEGSSLEKGHKEQLALEAARKLQQQLGRGTVKVKLQSKKDLDLKCALKSYNMDDDLFVNTSQRSVHKNVRDDVRGWKSVGTGSSYGRRERSKTPRNCDDRFMSPPRSRSPKDFRERKQRYSDDHSSNSIRSFSKRSISPAPSQEPSSPRHREPSCSRHREPSCPRYREPSCPRHRELSPKNYNSFRDDIEYPHFSKKSDSRDRMDYISPRYASTNREESVKQTSDNHKHQHQPSHQTSNQLRSFDSVLEATYHLSSEECYKMMHERMRSLPEVKDIKELVCLSKLIGEAQKKLKSKLSEEIMTALINDQTCDTSSNTIPGLDSTLSSSAKPLNITTSNLPKLVNAAAILSDFFENAYPNLGKMSTSQDKPSFPYPWPTSYAPAMSSQQSTLNNTYQAPPPSYQAPPPSYQFPPAGYQAPPAGYQAPPAGYQAPPAGYQAPPTSYQAPLANSYQDTSTGSYLNQSPCQLPNASVPFATSSVQNFPHNMPGLNPADKAPEQGFNYSHYPNPSTSSDLKNFPHKY